MSRGKRRSFKNVAMVGAAASVAALGESIMLGKSSTVFITCASICCLGGVAPAQNALHTVYGDAVGDHFGFAVSGAGDVDNDGFDDFIAGAFFNDVNGRDAGQIRVFSGRTRAVLYTRYGEAEGDSFGDSVSGVGDVNNDGFGDFMAGAGRSDANGLLTGLFKVFSGQTGEVLRRHGGKKEFEQLGHSVSGVGDVDNDGFQDYAAGAPGDSTIASSSGMIRVYSGLSGKVLYSRYGDDVGDRLGHSVSGAGDVDNDGFDDFVTGAYSERTGGPLAGMVRVFSGQTGAVLYSRHGDAWWDWMGYSVSGAGDVNNDGYDDVIAGAPQVDGTGLRPGMLRVYSGPSGGVLFSRSGDSGDDRLGFSVSGVGDADQDGFDDFVAGAFFNDARGPNSGMVRVYSGRSGAVLYQLHGDEVGDYFGESVSAAGDVNADGIPDIIVGASWNATNGMQAGMARVYTGPCARTEQYGFGCLGPNDTHIPVLWVETNCLGVGGAATLKIGNGWAGGWAYLLTSTQRASDHWQFDCSFLVQSPFSVLFVGSLIDYFDPPPNGKGWLDLPLSIPDPMPAGTVTFQVGIVQPGTTFTNLTNGVEINVP